MPFDLFSTNPMWTVSELSLALNRVPYVPGLIGRLGLFREMRLATTSTMVEVQGFRLALVPEIPRGAPPPQDVHDRATATSIAIPHFAIRDTLVADAIQNVRAFGGTGLEGIQSVINQRMASMSQKLDVTLEFLRLGAVRGKVITAVDRITGAPIVERDIFKLFDLPPNPVIEWPIIGAGRIGQEAAVWGGDLTGMVNALVRTVADQLPGGMLTRLHGICGWKFFDAFMAHPEIRAAYIAIENGPLLRDQLGTSFSFRGITIEEYRGRVGMVQFVAPDECHIFPVGVPDLFIEAYAPADYLETVNTIALPRYAKSEVMDWDKGVMMEAQMNVFPFCSLPGCLMTIKAVDYVP